MQIQSHFAPTPIALKKAPQSPPPTESFEPSKPEYNGLMPKPPQQNEKLSGVASGALYGGLAGAGIAVALGCATTGVGIIVGFATVPLGIAAGAGIGGIVDLFNS